MTVVRLAVGVRSVARALAAARQVAEAQGLAADMADRLAIVVEEWVANIVEHGAAAAGSRIVLRFEAGQGAMRLTISDAGRPFDPCAARDEGPNTERGGGAGLALIRTWCAMDYVRRGRRNRLTLQLR